MDNLETETNTMILEQCRLDMDNLAALGADAMSDAVAKAERRASNCGQDLRQATRAVELTAKQKKTVEDARLAGEEKLSSAIRDEEDARIAAEAVKRMIMDAASVRGTSNNDTAKILKKAENVLDETANHADRFYCEKKVQREEIERAMLRLYATEKAVLYTMAKAERNEGEKQLAKIVAEKKHEVYAAEYDVLMLDAAERELLTKSSDHRDNIRKLENQIVQAKTDVEDCTATLDKAVADFSAELLSFTEKNEAELADLENEQRQCEHLREVVKSELEDATKLLDERQQVEITCQERLATIQKQTQETISAARRDYERGVEKEDHQVSVYQAAAQRSQESLNEAIAKQESAEAEAERLRGLVEEFATKAAEAEADETSAREAAITANRLAENAIKIRESISSESSQLLFHAQEVLLEAAASAQRLMDEKSMLRVAAQGESERISKQAALAESTAHQSGELTDIKRSDCTEANLQLERVINAAEEKKAQLLNNMNQQIDRAEEQMQQADDLLQQAGNDVAEAFGLRDSAKKRLQELNENLENIVHRTAETRSEGEKRQIELKNYTERETARLGEVLSAAKLKVAELEKNCRAENNILTGLERDMMDIRDQIESASARVRDIISMGLIAIEQAEGDVQLRCYNEQEAHRLAEEAVAEMSAANKRTAVINSQENLSELIDEEKDSPAVLLDASDMVNTDVSELNAFPLPDLDSLTGSAKPTQRIEKPALKKTPTYSEVKMLPELDVPAEIELPPELKLPAGIELPPELELKKEAAPSEKKPVFEPQVVAPAQREVAVAPKEQAAAEIKPLIKENISQVFDKELEEKPLIPDEVEPSQAAEPEKKPAEKVDIPETNNTQRPQESVLATPAVSAQEPPIEEQPLILDDDDASLIFSFAESLRSSETIPLSTIAAPDAPAVVEAESAETLAPAEMKTPMKTETTADSQPSAVVAETPKKTTESLFDAPDDDESIDPRHLNEEDEVAQAVMKAVNEAAARISSAEDGDKPYEGNALSGEISPMLEQDLELTGSWSRDELSPEEKEYTTHLEKLGDRLLEHTIIPMEDNDDSLRAQKSEDWLSDLTRSLSEEPVVKEKQNPISTAAMNATSAKGQTPAAGKKDEIDISSLLKAKNTGEAASSVSDKQIKMPELELPAAEEITPKRRLETTKSNRRRHFPFFN